MTLILTWLFHEGIVMGTDSAVTRTIASPSGVRIRRILTGYKKVYHIPKINAGISCWGKGEVDGYPLDVWLPDFISHEENYGDIHELAISLQNRLRDAVPELTCPEDSVHYRYGDRGFHLAGYVEYQGQQVPTCYHIHNGQSETNPDINPRKINANHDLPPHIVLKVFSEDKAPHLRNGDFRLYARIFERLTALFLDLHMRSRESGSLFIFPDPSKFMSILDCYSEFVRFWIRFLRDVYALSNIPEIIGGDISILSIAPTGETNYSTRP